MKPTRAFLACSLLGTLWLASCSGDNKKAVLPAGDAGEGGEAAGSAGAPAESGAGGSPSAGEAGAGVAGAAGETGQGGASGQAGAGGALACFNAGIAAAGTSGFDLGEGGAPGAVHLQFSCETLKGALTPTYDPIAGTVTLDATQLGPVTSGTFTYFYDWNNGDGTSIDCGDKAVQVADSKLVLPIATTHDPLQIRVTALAAQDECGNDAVLSPVSETNSNFCFNLTFFDNEGTWQVDCFEGNCYPTCAVYSAGAGT